MELLTFILSLGWLRNGRSSFTEQSLGYKATILHCWIQSGSSGDSVEWSDLNISADARQFSIDRKHLRESDKNYDKLLAAHLERTRNAESCTCEVKGLVLILMLQTCSLWESGGREKQEPSCAKQGFEKQSPWHCSRVRVENVQGIKQLAMEVETQVECGDEKRHQHISKVACWLPRAAGTLKTQINSSPSTTMLPATLPTWTKLWSGLTLLPIIWTTSKECELFTLLPQELRSEGLQWLSVHVLMGGNYLPWLFSKKGMANWTALQDTCECTSDRVAIYCKFKLNERICIHFKHYMTLHVILPPLTQICYVFLSCVQRRVVEGSGVSIVSV